jgi:CHAT domain-containing protein/tetratricopeptide (TPR) repeat protein
MVGAGRLRYPLVLAAVGALGFVAAAPAQAQKRPPRHPRHGPVAAPLDEIAQLEKQLLGAQVRGAMIPSLRLARKIYQLKARKLGPDHPDAGRALAQVAQLTAATGDYAGALAIHRDIAARAEKRHGKSDPAVLPALEGLAGQLWMAQRFDEADVLYQRVLALRRAQSGADSALYAAALQTYAALLTGRHAYDAAEEKYLEAKAILDRTGKPDDPSQSGLLMSLGLLYWSEGQQQRAVHQFDRAIAILEKFYGETIKDPSQAAGLILGVASIYATGGRADLARPLEERGERLYRQAVADIEKQHGATDVRLVAPLSSLAQLHQRRKQWDDAERLLRRVMAIQAAQKGASPLSSITWLFSLAYLERQRGHARAALPMLHKVRALYRRLYGEYMASTMDHQIADVWRELGDYRAARRILERVLVTSRRTWGPRHPLVATQLSSLAMLHMAEGHARPAVARMREALDIEEPQLALVLATGTESDHATFFGQIAYQLHMAITLHARYAPRDRDAARLAMTTVLRRKGRILDAAAASVATLRGKLGPDDQKVLDDLAAARAQLAALIVAGPKATDSPEDYSVEVGRLEREVKRLEDIARRRSAAYRVQSQPIELDAVQKAIPADGVLVEIVAYQPYDARAVGPWDPSKQPPRRYGAYLLRRTGDPSWVEMGDAKTIDAAADAFLAALADPDRSDVSALGRALHDRALKGLVAQLGQTRRVLIAPDGLLNLVPFGAVVDTSGRHLIQRFTFSYLTSGRDLLRLGAGARAKRGPVIVADPRFDSADPEPAGPKKPAAVRPGAVVASRGLRSRDLRGKRWAPLPGTAEEADALVSLLGQVEVLRGTHATEAALKKVAGPRILHIATHGFFLPAEAVRPPDSAAAAPAAPALPIASPAAAPAQADLTAPENPLLRSGLVLAGANRLSSGGEDGILTALEAAGLDLWGTQMVVLSACETGVGKVTEGDGVHGLRRALVIAGAESLVMSLWQVDDRATRELMAGFYRRLEQGEGRSDALRQVQLQMLRRPRTSHPYYWASFVPTGSWAPLAPVKE